MLGSFLIAVPTGVKIFNWIATLWRGTVEFTTRAAVLRSASSGTFLIGGITGIFLAVFPVDWQLHDTYFVVAHFHYVLMGGAVFGDLRRHLLLVPEDHGPDAERGAGQGLFWLMLIGFHVTFLIQHSMGLTGMPRRIYAYPDVGDLALYNLISTIGSFILGVGILVTVINVAAQSLQAAAPSPGPDPWKANTLEWFTTLAAAGQQLRRRAARALGRADEGHPPPGRAPVRRAVDRARPRRRRSPLVRGLMSRSRAAAVAPAPRRARVRSLADYVELTKPKVQSLLLFTTVTTMLVAGHAVDRADPRHVPGRLPVGRRRRRGQPLVTTATSTPRMARTANRPVPSGRVSPARRAVASASRWPRSRCVELSLLVNPLAAALSLQRLPGLRVRLHGLAEAPHAAEHRHRRRRRRGARRSSAGPRSPARLDGTALYPLRHRLLLDAAALLGAVAADEGRVRARSACRCCPSSAARTRRGARSCSTRSCSTR